jgi:hypothetical protein
MFRKHGDISPFSVLRTVKEPLTRIARRQFDRCASHVHTMEFERVGDIAPLVFSQGRGRSCVRVHIHRPMVAVILVAKLCSCIVAHSAVVVYSLAYGVLFPAFTFHPPLLGCRLVSAMCRLHGRGQSLWLWY